MVQGNAKDIVVHAIDMENELSILNGFAHLAFDDGLARIGSCTLHFGEDRQVVIVFWLIAEEIRDFSFHFHTMQISWIFRIRYGCMVFLVF